VHVVLLRCENVPAKVTPGKDRFQASTFAAGSLAAIMSR
jgi:hypothetical protein